MCLSFKSGFCWFYLGLMSHMSFNVLHFIIRFENWMCICRVVTCEDKKKEKERESRCLLYR